MPAKKLSIPVTPDMTKALDELCELHALQLPSLASMLLRDALAGRRSPLLPKRVSACLRAPQRRKTAQSLSRHPKARKNGFWTARLEPPGR